MKDHLLGHRTAVVFIISDFQDETFEKSLKILSRKHDVIAIHLKDRREQEMPSAGLVEFRDQETGQTTLIDTSAPGFRKQFQKQSVERTERINKLFKTLQIDKVEVNVEGSYIEPLMRFFKIREQRL